MTTKTEDPVKILLVDDRPENLLGLEVILANKNYELIRANTGKEALRILLSEQSSALILLDAMMPIMDGYETAELIRQNEKVKYIPIIFLTAQLNTPANIFKGYQAGGVDYMLKPLSPEILKAKVAIFVDLCRKNQELLEQKEQMKVLNDYVTATNKGLALQNIEKEKMAAELIIAKKELLAFNYIVSHDLQEPLRKIQIMLGRVLEKENLSQDGNNYLQIIWKSAERMRILIQDLLIFASLSKTEIKLEKTDLNKIIEQVKEEFEEVITEKRATIEVGEICEVNVIPSQFRQLLQNLIGNALKFSDSKIPPHILVKSQILEPESRGFTGIGLAIVRKIVDNHSGIITASSELKKGTTFDIYIPENEVALTKN
ncbi:MAG: response regulator [Burkholderiales bacterium]|nr:response regulator [Flavobacterium sp.]